MEGERIPITLDQALGIAAFTLLLGVVVPMLIAFHMDFARWERCKQSGGVNIEHHCVRKDALVVAGERP